MEKMQGHIIFYWEDGHKLEVPFGRNLVGIQHEGRRPRSYAVSITAGIVSEVEAARLNDWLRRDVVAAIIMIY